MHGSRVFQKIGRLLALAVNAKGAHPSRKVLGEKPSSLATHTAVVRFCAPTMRLLHKT